MNERVVLAVGALLVLAGVGVGVYVFLPGDVGPPAVNQVPADVDAVVHVDAAITDDAASTELADTGLERVSVIDQVPNSTTDALDEFESQTGLDPGAADEVVAFRRQTNRSTGQEDVGVIVHGNWDEEDVIESVRGDADRELTETTYEGQTVYRPATGEGSDSTSGQWIGVLGDGQYVFGSEAAVKETVDVTSGDADNFDGRLRKGYDDAPDGLVTFAVRVPTERIPEETGRGIELTRYRQVTVVSGSYYSMTNGAGVEMRLLTNSSEAAKDLEDVTSGMVATLSLTAQNESVRENLDVVEVEREGRTVIISYEQSIDSIRALLRHYQQDLADDRESIHAAATTGASS